jgi:hypothetical protein
MTQSKILKLRTKKFSMEMIKLFHTLPKLKKREWLYHNLPRKPIVNDTIVNDSIKIKCY